MATVIWCTVPNALSATKIAGELVGSKLAACVNIVPGIKSVYEWEDKIQESSELLLCIKTRAELFSHVQQKILALHEYEVPEIIATPISESHPPYLNWIMKNCL